MVAKKSKCVLSGDKQRKKVNFKFGEMRNMNLQHVVDMRQRNSECIFSKILILSDVFQTFWISVLFSECVALYNYTGEVGDLSFSEGDVIKVHKDEGEWWEGSCRGEQGLFPANYVKKKETEVTL